MVYMRAEAVGWLPYVQSWIEREFPSWDPDLKQHILGMFQNHIDKGLTYLRKGMNEPIPTVNIQQVVSLCSLFKSLIMSDEAK
jgi:dynein heavy chain